MGRMGMSLQDFDRCTPLEFEKIFEMWHESKQLALRTSWEQTRLLACCILQPYAKKELRATDVMEFEWDKPESKGPAKKTRKEREAEKRRYEQVKKERGLV